MNDAVHLSHASSLTKVDVSADGTPRAPFMQDHEAERLDVCQARVIQGQPNEVARLQAEMFSRLRRPLVPSEALDEHWRVSGNATFSELKRVDKRRPTSSHLPCSRAQQSLDHDTVDSIAPQLLNKGRLVEGDTGWHNFVDDSLALVEHFWTKPAWVLMLVIILSGRFDHPGKALHRVLKDGMGDS